MAKPREYTIIPGGQRVRRKQNFTNQDIRFTQKEDVIYAILLDWPGEKITIKSLAKNSELFEEKIKSVSMLGSKETIKYDRDSNGLTVFMPETKPCKYSFILKIET